MSHINKDEFLKSYSAFSKIHTWIVISFLIILALQVLLFNLTGIIEYFAGYKFPLFLATEILAFFIISKIHEVKSKPRCPKCSKGLVYRKGYQVSKSGICPYCNAVLFE